MDGEKRRRYYPIFLDVEDRDVLIVGGGEVSARKAETLLRCGARVEIVSPRLTPEIRRWADQGLVRLQERSYRRTDVDGRWLVIASTDDLGVNEEVSADCRERGVPVNVVDVTDLCDFIVPSVIERGSIQIAVSTGGRSPALARTIREVLQNVVGPEFGEINDLLGSLRSAAKEALATDRDRKQFFDSIIAAGVLDMIREGRRGDAYRLIAELCSEAGVPLSAELSAGLQA